MSVPDLPVQDAAPTDAADAGVGVADASVDAVGGDAGPALPRLLSPLSTATATARRPTFRWVLAGGADGADIEWCRDRACTLLIERAAVRGATARPARDLPPGWVFWRVRWRTGSVLMSTTSPTWQVLIGARAAPIDTSFGTTLDVNGDGYADLVVGASRYDPEGRSRAGMASVYLGGAAGIGATPARVLEGGAAGDAFGRSVASAGDFNGYNYLRAPLGVAPMVGRPAATRRLLREVIPDGSRRDDAMAAVRGTPSASAASGAVCVSCATGV